ncbi:hypothetical protein SNE40_010325 [Patella caerulea]|uniref:Histone H2A n=1 Tax=Patella caerulea TaxID=87958 RepID=A0AAN8JQA1_PATCE
MSEKPLIVEPDAVKRRVWRSTGKPASDGAVIYLAGVLEYIMAEILDLSATRVCYGNKIRPEHVIKAIRQDPELDEFLLKDVNASDVGDKDDEILSTIPLSIVKILSEFFFPK